MCCRRGLGCDGNALTHLCAIHGGSTCVFVFNKIKNIYSQFCVVGPFTKITVVDNVTRLRFCEGINCFSLELINAPWEYPSKLTSRSQGILTNHSPAEPVANVRVAAHCLVVSLFPLLTRLKQHASPQRSAPLALSTQATIPIFPPSLPFQLFYIFALWRQGIGAVQ